MSERNLINVTRRFNGTPISLQRDNKHKQNPFVIAFVYAQNKNYLIVGGIDEVKEYVNNLGVYALVNFYFARRKRANSWRIFPSREGFFVKEKHVVSRKTYEIDRGFLLSSNTRFGFNNAPKSVRYSLEFNDGKKFNDITRSTVTFFYRRIPKKWLSEWTEAIEALKSNRTGTIKTRRNDAPY